MIFLVYNDNIQEHDSAEYKPVLNKVQIKECVKS